MAGYHRQRFLRALSQGQDWALVDNIWKASSSRDLLGFIYIVEHGSSQFTLERMKSEMRQDAEHHKHCVDD